MTDWSRYIELPPPVDVLDMPLAPLDKASLAATAVARAKAGVPTTACYANAHTMNLAWRDDQFRRVLTDCDLLYADGASLVWASRWSRARLPERMTAADYFPLMAAACAEAGVSIFLLGNQPGVVDKAAEVLTRDFPTLRITGKHHGHFDLAQSDRVIEHINSTRPDIVFVGMSSPRQEMWLAEHGHKLTAPVKWCVGALFDYYAGVERRGPVWMCRMGCEWLYRLLMDPVGKWRRYLVGNPVFVFRTLKWAFGRRSVKDGGVGIRTGQMV